MFLPSDVDCVICDITKIQYYLLPYHQEKILFNW
jgi:hypothetical protein